MVSTGAGRGDGADGGAQAGRGGAAAARRIPSLVVLIVGGIGFGVLAGIAGGALASTFVPLSMAACVGIATAIAWVLPLFLAVRATLALKRNGKSVLLRRFVQFFLVGLVQLTMWWGAFTFLGQGKASATGEMAAAAWSVFHDVPVLGGMLEKRARDEHATLPGAGVTKPGGDGKPDGGTPEGGTVVDGGVAGGAVGAVDGGVAGNGAGSVVDGGVATTNGAGLSPRVPGGRVVRTAAAAVTTTTGDLLVVVWQVAFGGATTTRVIDLTAHAALGSPTRVMAAADGNVVVVLAGAHVLLAGPTATTATLDKGLSRGATIGDLEVQSVRDVAIAPGGALLAVVEGIGTGKGAKPGQALVARSASGAASVVRKSDDVVERGEKRTDPDTLAHGWSIKDGDGSGAIVVEEELLDGGVDVAPKLSGDTWVMNPRRLLAGRVDAPRALAEVARTDVEPSGLDKLSLQAFGDATWMPDGRVWFEANFVEAGARGWLFTARVGSGVFAVVPELLDKDGAPWTPAAPRLKHLSIEPDGALAFVNRDGALVLSSTSKPADAKVALVRAEAWGGDGVRVGSVSAVRAPALAQGGEWLLADVTLLAEGALPEREAVVLCSRADLAAARAEVLLVDGGLVPATTPPPERRVKSVFFLEGHEEPLWP